MSVIIKYVIATALKQSIAPLILIFRSRSQKIGLENMIKKSASRTITIREEELPLMNHQG